MFNSESFVRISAQIDTKNKASRRLAERLKFEMDAVLPQANLGGKIADIAYYSVSRKTAQSQQTGCFEFFMEFELIDGL